MKIGILGSEEVGQRLADGFIVTGHTVKVGMQSLQKVASWAAKNTATRLYCRKLCGCSCI